MANATRKLRVDPLLNFRHGVRKDGTEWLTVTHPLAPGFIRLSMPNDPEYDVVQRCFTAWCCDRKEASSSHEKHPA